METKRTFETGNGLIVEVSGLSDDDTRSLLVDATEILSVASPEEEAHEALKALANSQS